jgi:hypothetical protein
MIKKINKIVTIGMALLLIIPGMAFGLQSSQKVRQEAKEEIKVSVDKVNDAVNKVTLSIGQKPNAGYDIQIVRIDFKDEYALITYHLTAPEDGKNYADVITEPKAVTYLASDYKPVLQSDGNFIPGQSGNGVNDYSISEQAGIRGTITQVVEVQETIYKQSGIQQNASSSVTNKDTNWVESNNIINVIQVEAKADSGSLYDKAHVRLRDTTKIYKQKGDQLVPGSKEELKKGGEIEVYFVGPVPETYPVQANAGKIIIMETK